MTAREIDIHTLPSMLTTLRLPSFHKLWQEIASPFFEKVGPTPKAGLPPGSLPFWRNTNWPSVTCAVSAAI